VDVISAARHADPDFVPSLRLLVERERYSLLDIGLMFGVSRERARQWCVRYGIVHPDSGHARGFFARRIWNDALNRFEPFPTSLLRRDRIAEQRRERNAARARRLSERRSTLIARAVALKAQLGRDPSHQEIAAAVLGHPVERQSAAQKLLNWWCSTATSKNRDERRRQYADMKATLAAAGIRPRPLGTPGHVSGVQLEAYRAYRGISQ
jgi:hypothetical protein